MKKILTIILYFLLLVIYVFGVTGSIVCLAVNGCWPLSLCIAFVAYMAYPKAREYFDKMMA
ncbi:MAG: hypothetical protein II636_04155 [Bacteroidales bacterium]|nr:hypothetical protein [Bacteroidales bacterium]